MSRFGDVVSHHLGMVLPLEMVKCSLIQGKARAGTTVAVDYPWLAVVQREQFGAMEQYPFPY